MAPKRSIWTQRVFEECTDDWRPVEEVIAAAVPTVPPGKALRQYEGRDSRRLGKKLLTEDEKIYSGARHYVVNSIRTLTHSGQLEVKAFAVGDGVVDMVHRVPSSATVTVVVPPNACPTCHRPYDQPGGEVVASPFVPREYGQLAKVIFPPQFNQRRFG